MSAYNLRPVPRTTPAHPHRFLVWLWPLLVILIIVGIYAAYCLLRPVAALQVTITPPVIPGQVKVNVPWPAAGQAAFGAVGYGLLAAHGEEKPLPTASVAKTITALAILEKKPLKPGEQGPDITMTDKDVALYDSYVAKDGSTVPVYAGEPITEYQALQAMMLPSANNMADTMAIWAFGSLDNYHAFAKDFTARLGLEHTTVATDASGFSPTTTSTASDLVRLGIAALANPVLSDIVSQKSADFPNYGPIDNVNTLLGQYGIRGIKTGNTDQAGGVYLAAADVVVGGKNITVIAAVMGSPTLGDAMRSAVPMVQASVSEFQNVQVIRAGQITGQVTSAWGATSDIIAGKTISVLTWNGTALSPHVHSRSITAPTAVGPNTGSLPFPTHGATSPSPLATASAISSPTWQWRLSHPF